MKRCSWYQQRLTKVRNFLREPHHLAVRSLYKTSCISQPCWKFELTSTQESERFLFISSYLSRRSLAANSFRISNGMSLHLCHKKLSLLEWFSAKLNTWRRRRLSHLLRISFEAWSCSRVQPEKAFPVLISVSLSLSCWFTWLLGLSLFLRTRWKWWNDLSMIILEVDITLPSSPKFAKTSLPQPARTWEKERPMETNNNNIELLLQLCTDPCRWSLEKTYRERSTDGLKQLRTAMWQWLISQLHVTTRCHIGNKSYSSRTCHLSRVSPHGSRVSSSRQTCSGRDSRRLGFDLLHTTTSSQQR